MTKTTMLITGAAGFLGSNLTQYILKKYPDYRIIILDSLTYAGCMDNIPKDSRVQFCFGDVRNSELVNKLVAESNLVVHMAAESITSDTYLPMWNHGIIEVLTLEEMFKRCSKKGTINISSNGVETIDFIAHGDSWEHKTLSYKGGIGYWGTIRQISRHKYTGKVIRLTQKWGEVTTTPNHAVYDCNFDVASPTSNPELLGLRNINHIPEKSTALGLSGEKLRALVRVFGSYIPEGWTTHKDKPRSRKANRAYQCGFANNNADWLLSIQKDLSLLGYRSNITWGGTKRTTSQLMVSCNKELFKLLRKHAGYTSHGKQIPPFIFQLKRELQEEFLSQLVSGDGEVIHNRNYDTRRYTTVSRKLATGLSLLLSLLKLNYSVSVDKRFNAYTFSFGGCYTESLLEKRYEEIDYDGYVYDVSVNQFENFVCGVGNVVVHNTHVTRSIFDNLLFFQTDVLGTQSVANAVAGHRSHIDRFIHLSTSEVYGTALTDIMDEEHPLMPSSPYASAKTGADRLVYSYWKTYDIPAVILRPFNQFGAHQHLEKMIPRFITSCILNEPITIHGDGSSSRDWVYVQDTCEAIDKALHCKLDKVKGEVINLGSGVSTSVQEIADKILSVMNQSKKLVTYTEDRPGQVLRHTSSTDKAAELLGWRAKTELTDGLIETINWYQQNRPWWEKQLWMRSIQITTKDGKKVIH